MTHAEPKQLGFDYSAVDESTCAFLKARAGRIHILARVAAQDIVEIGQHLTEIKERLNHGEFVAWVEAEFGWTIRSAQMFMTVYRQFKNENISHLRINLSALYQISSPRTPEPVRAEIIRRAENGEQITHDSVRRSVAAFAATNDLTVSPEPCNRVLVYVEPRPEPKPIVVLASVTHEPREPIRVLVNVEHELPRPVSGLASPVAPQAREGSVAGVTDEVEEIQSPVYSNAAGAHDIFSQEPIAEHDRVRPLIEFLVSLRKPVDPNEMVNMLRARDLIGISTKADVRWATRWLSKLSEVL